MSTPLPRATFAAPTKPGKKNSARSEVGELRDFRRASPFDQMEHSEHHADSEFTAFPGETIRLLSKEDDRPPSGGKIKPGRSVSTPQAPSQGSQSARVDRRFWPRDTRAVLELCEQGYALQQGMQSHCKETADSLNGLADTCENTVKAMLLKLEETLSKMQKEAETPKNVDWMPIFHELNQRIGPDIAKEVLARQELASTSMQDQIDAKLTHMVDRVGDTLDLRHEAQRADLLQLQEDLKEVQRGSLEFEKAQQRSQEEMVRMLMEQQSSLQVYVKEVINKELREVMVCVEENKQHLLGIEPLLAAQLTRQLHDSKAIDKEHHKQIHQIHKTLHVDLGQLFYEIAEIQKGMNLPFLHLHTGDKDHYVKSKEGHRAREFHTQTEQLGSEISTQTDLAITMPVDGKKKKERKEEKKRNTEAALPKGVMSQAVHAMHEKAKHADGPILENDGEKRKHMMQKLIKPQYNVAGYYYDRGCSQAIARSVHFENITLLVIVSNAIWIAIDTDYNSATVLPDAHMVFQAAENLFCTFFTGELLIRFLAFRRKRDCVRDFWFVFDSILVAGMIAETWVLTFVMTVINNTDTDDGGGSKSLSILRVARLVKMFRMARMARLLRMVPELMMILKGIWAALRSVWFFALLTVIILYVFAVAFRQITKDTEVGERHFKTVPRAMGYLLLDGMLPIYAPIVKDVSDENPFLWPVMMIFILLASVTILNMLIGVLSEVVREVAFTEKEAMTVTHTTQVLKEIMSEFQGSAEGEIEATTAQSGIFRRRTSFQNIDDGALTRICRDDFEKFVMKDRVAHILQDVGVDPVGLVDMAEVIFEDKDKDNKGITFEDFIEVVLNLRGSNPATVKDIKETQRILKHTVYETRTVNKKNMSKEISDFRVDVASQFMTMLREVRKIQHHSDSEDDSDGDFQSFITSSRSRFQESLMPGERTDGRPPPFNNADPQRHSLLSNDSQPRMDRVYSGLAGRVSHDDLHFDGFNQVRAPSKGSSHEDLEIQDLEETSSLG